MPNALETLCVTLEVNDVPLSLCNDLSRPNLGMISGSSFFFFFFLPPPQPSLVAQMVKRLPTMWETRFQSLSQDNLLEKEMATHSSILAWKIAWMEEPGGLQSMGSQESDMTE